MAAATLVRASLEDRPDRSSWICFLKPIDEYPVEVQERAKELNFELGFRFLQDVISDPMLSDRIPEGAHIVHIIEGESDVSAFNLALGARAADEGAKVIVVRWERVR